MLLPLLSALVLGACSGNGGNNNGNGSDSGNGSGGDTPVNRQVTQEEFKKAFSEAEASAQTTSYNKMVFQGISVVKVNSLNQELRIGASTFDVAWDANKTPTFTASADVDTNANGLLDAHKDEVVLNASVIDKTSSLFSRFYIGSEFRIESRIENTGSDGNKTTVESISTWNFDLLLTTSKKTLEEIIVESTTTDFTFAWSK